MERDFLNTNAAKEAFTRAAQRNHKLFEAQAKKWTTQHAREFKKDHGYDPRTVLAKEGFSLAKVATQLREQKYKEETTSSQVYGLTTGLVTQNMTGEYMLVPTVYRNVAKILSSTKSEESLFPLQRTDVPGPLEDNETPGTSGLSGINVRIKNYRFAKIFEYSQTLEEDDQTGQVADSATMEGQNMVYAEELWWATQLIGNYGTGKIRTSGGIIPDMCIAGQGGNDPNYGGPTCTAGPITRDGLANLLTAADFVTDLEGNLALVSVDTLVGSSADKITINTILKSDFNPNTISGSANVLNGIFAKNVLEDIVVAQFTRFFKYFTGSALNGGNVWFLGEAGKIGAFQDRTPLSVTMESPLAGKSWENKLRRTMADRRFGAGVVLPEFALRGN